MARTMSAAVEGAKRERRRRAGVGVEPDAEMEVYGGAMNSTRSLQLLRRGLLAAGLTSILFLQSGCFIVAAGAAGAGAVAYVRGELQVSLPNDYENVVRATNRAIEQLQFVKISERKDALSDKVEARTAQDKKIVIELTKVADKLTKVEIRVGLVGNEQVSQTILDKIKANL